MKLKTTSCLNRTNQTHKASIEKPSNVIYAWKEKRDTRNKRANETLLLIQLKEKHLSHFWVEEESLRVKTHWHWNGRNSIFFLTQRLERILGQN